MKIRKKINEMEMRIEEDERVKSGLKQQLDESIENSHEVSLVMERLGETEKELLGEKVKCKDLEQRNN